MKFVFLLLTAGCAAAPLSSLGRNSFGAEEYRRAVDGMILVRIPAGDVILADGKTDRLDRDILIDKYEVSNEQFAAFMNAAGKDEYVDPRVAGLRKVEGRWRGDTGRENHPVAAATFWGAQAYADWVGAHLPSRLEWTRAARGSDGRCYPWGDESPDATFCNFGLTGLQDTAPVGSFPKGASPYGVMDMAGNVYERVRQDTEHSRLPRAGMLKSGAYVCPLSAQVSVSGYCGYRTDASHPSIGFRTVTRP